MRASIAIFAVLHTLCLAGNPDDQPVNPDIYEAIHEAESTLALTLDTKDWARLGDSMTNDVFYDSRPLGPDYGGLSVGLAQATVNIQASFKDADVAHHVSNAIIRLNRNDTIANVTTYIVWSQWDSKALDDPKKTFRVYEKCKDLWVLDDGKWKLKYSLVTNLAPKVENPYFSNGTYARD